MLELIIRDGQHFSSRSFYVKSGVSKTIALLIDLKFHRTYKLLNVLEFNSARKRMSVIIRDEDGKVLLLCKGADRYVNCDQYHFHSSPYIYFNCIVSS